MVYTGNQLKEIIFPLGGIGSGCFGLTGSGRLVDFELDGRPNKGTSNGYSHFAVSAGEGKDKNCRVLCGDVMKDVVGQYEQKFFTGYGFGPRVQTMAGFPHFRDVTFRGEMPFAGLTFSDPDFPGRVTLSAWNPLIPQKSLDSSLPAAFFSITFENTADRTLPFTAAFSVANPFPHGMNKKTALPGTAGVSLVSVPENDDEPTGDLTLLCAEQDANAQAYWYRGGWMDPVSTYWNEFSGDIGFRDRVYDTPGKLDTATVSVTRSLAPGESATVRFLLTWSIPHHVIYWYPKDENGKLSFVKNYYATVFENSEASARYALKEWERLEKESRLLPDLILSSSVDPAAKDAALSCLSVLKSTTVLRLTDGSFWGWEGEMERNGSCEGTCEHVWNYAYALCFLFPDLERSIRDMEFQYNQKENGGLIFRIKLPLTCDQGSFRPCLDGQMGTVIKVYREWKLSGDGEWLKGKWENVKKALAFAWSEDNPDAWDRDHDGVLEGRQHHTLDMELFGPSGWLEGFYLAALRAGTEMAMFLSDEEAANEYRSLFEKGYAFCRDTLFNGSYFAQKLDLKDRSVVDRFDCASEYWNDEAGEIKYQIGEGCEIDQLCGQWHASLCGLGRIFDEKQTKSALDALYRHNFKPTLRNFANRWRVFALEDESAALMCEYPDPEKRPAIPLPYGDEAMTGFEYQLAGSLIAGGETEKGLKIVRAIRGRYTGEKRNPYNEIECGSHYARCMAAFALLPLLAGFSFDLPHDTIGFAPVGIPTSFRFPFFVGTGWGSFTREGEKAVLSLCGGSLTLRALSLTIGAKVQDIRLGEKKIAFAEKDGFLIFDPLRIVPDTPLTLTLA